MTIYQSKPSLIDAVLWDDTDETVDQLWNHTDEKIEVRFSMESGERTLYLLAGKDGAQEMVPVPVGHWIVHSPGDTSNIWPVENDYFQSKYEKVVGDE